MKFVATLFLVFLSMSGLHFFFTEEIDRLLYSIFGAYVLPIIITVQVLTIILAVLMVILLILQKRRKAGIQP